jgi:heme/copper-type cytochrome/quinol oxidase subunit 3
MSILQSSSGIVDVQQQRLNADALSTELWPGRLGTNTAVLLISSLLMAFAVRAAKLDQKRMLTDLRSQSRSRKRT